MCEASPWLTHVTFSHLLCPLTVFNCGPNLIQNVARRRQANVGELIRRYIGTELPPERVQSLAGMTIVVQALPENRQ
jgi:hypothetical protein